MDDLTFRHQTVDHPGLVPCPHCGQMASLSADEPWLIVDGVPRQPHVPSFLCPYCRYPSSRCLAGEDQISGVLCL